MADNENFRPAGWRNAGARPDRPEVVDIEFATPEYAMAFIQGLEPTVTLEAIASVVRDACIDEVSSLIDEYRQAAEKASSESSALPLKGRVTFGECITDRLRALRLNKVIAQLNSPTGGK